VLYYSYRSLFYKEIFFIFSFFIVDHFFFFIVDYVSIFGVRLVFCHQNIISNINRKITNRDLFVLYDINMR